jgi:hypothetical protein
MLLPLRQAMDRLKEGAGGRWSPPTLATRGG